MVGQSLRLLRIRAFLLMNISRKLLIIVCLTVIEVSITVWATLEIANGAKLHQLNFLHLKYDLRFSKLIDSYEKGEEIDVNALRDTVLLIKQQPLDCMAAMNIVNETIMKAIGTYNAVVLCEKDIKDADLALMYMDQYADGQLDRLSFIRLLKMASNDFSETSSKFEKPIEQTVSFILKTLIPAIIIISLLNIIFITYLSRTITGSIKNVISLLSSKSQDSREVDAKIADSVTGELKELLDIAKLRIENDLLNIETSKQLQGIVEERTHSLQQANDELAQFAYRASHDLKAPLSSSKSLLNFICSDIVDGEYDEAHANIKKTYQQIDKLERLVSDILSLTKAELGNETREEIDIDSIIDDIEHRLAWMIEQKHCNITTKVLLDTPIYSEKVRFVQILENIISNSIKYSHSERSPTIIVTLFSENKKIQLKIEDNGIGIPEKYWPEMFKLFKRFHPDIGSGSGLGLSIVKKHIDYLNGNITFDSTDQGTAFTIAFDQAMFTEL